MCGFVVVGDDVFGYVYGVFFVVVVEMLVCVVLIVDEDVLMLYDVCWMCWCVMFGYVCW